MTASEVLRLVKEAPQPQSDRWRVSEAELSAIGNRAADQMTLDEKVSELSTMLDLIAKYPPAYGNRVNAPFLERAGELLGRSLSFAEATDRKGRLLELAEQSSDMLKIIQDARAEELSHILSEVPLEEIGAAELQRISQLVGRQATLGDIGTPAACQQLVEKVRTGELSGRLPSDEYLPN